jgi:hypothetical protein
MKKCTHYKGDGSWWLKDARGIPIGRVCEKCEDKVKEKFRPEIFTDSNYDTYGERVDDDY